MAKTGEVLVIATPHMGTVCTDWAVALRLLEIPIPFMVLTVNGIPVDKARNWLVKHAQDVRADWVFFLDSDVLVPPDGLKKLLAHNLPVVSGLYGSRNGYPVAMLKGDDPRCHSTVPIEALERDALYSSENLGIGMGCCLIKMSVFDQLSYPWFVWTNDPMSNPQGLSEDLFFCASLQDLGVRVHIDPQVRCKHLDVCQIDHFGKREKVDFVWEIVGDDSRETWPK